LANEKSFGACSSPPEFDSAIRATEQFISIALFLSDDRPEQALSAASPASLAPANTFRAAFSPFPPLAPTPE